MVTDALLYKDRNIKVKKTGFKYAKKYKLLMGCI